MKSKLFVGVAILIFIAFAALGVITSRNTKDRLEFNKVQLNNRANEIKLEQIKSKDLYNKLNDNSAKTEQQIKDYEKQLQESKQREQELQSQLQAKIDTKNRLAQAQSSLASAVTATKVASAAPLSNNAAKAFIYAHESGNRTDAINASSGACGLGQALPCSKMGCSLQDYACQDAFFTNYAIQRYGSWEGAMYFWQNHSWW